MARVLDLLKVRPGEGRLVLLVIGIMLLTSAGGSIGGTGIEALFYSRFGVEFLPYLYMALGPTVLITSLAITGLLGRARREVLFAILPLVLGGVLLGEWLLVSTLHLQWFYPTMWVIMNVLGMLQGLLTWGLAGMVCDARQSKRLFPLFGAGGILGAVIGGFVTRPLVTLIGSESLLLIWAGALGITFVLGRVLTGGMRFAPTPKSRRTRKPQASFIREIGEGYEIVRRSSLLRWMALTTVLFAVLYFSLAFPFSKAATAQFTDTDALAGFLGLFNGASTGVALIVSLTLANRAYARLGIMTTILVLPLIYLAGFAGLAVAASFFVLVGFRFIQTVWLMGVSNPAYQAVFNVVPSNRRDQTRAFFSGGPEQAGTVIAGLILIVGEQALGAQQLYLVGLVVAGIAVFAIFRARTVYGSALVDLLKIGQPQVFLSEEEPFGGIQRDAAAVRVAVESMSSPNPAVRRVSAEIVGRLAVPQAIDALVVALRDTDPGVRAASLKGLGLAGASTALLDVALCLTDPEPDVRLAALDALKTLATYPHGLAGHARRLLSDADPTVRAKAATLLLAAGPDQEAGDLLNAMSTDLDPATRAAAISGFGYGRIEGELKRLEDGLADSSPLVRAESANGLARVGTDEAVTRLVNALGDEDRVVVSAVVQALGEIGMAAHSPLIAALDNPALEAGALAAVENLPLREAAPALMAYTRKSADRALGYHGLYKKLLPLDGDDRKVLLAKSVEEKAISCAMNAIRAASIGAGRETARLALDNLTSRDASQRASALETLESTVRKDVIRPLLPVWEDRQPETSSIEDWLIPLLADPDAWLRTCAAFAAPPDMSQAARDVLKHAADTEIDALALETMRAALPGAPASLAPGFRGKNDMETLPTLSIMDRILFLQKVPLFASMSPSDLKRVASVATERYHRGGDVIAEQGEGGEEMYIIVSGEVRVLVEEGNRDKEVARRKSGDAVGEMAIIAQEPRIATLAADGDVRLLVIERKQFEGILRERPETGLAVMRVLIARLKELQAKPESAQQA